MTSEAQSLREALLDKTNQEAWYEYGSRGPITDVEVMPAAAEFNRGWDDFNAAVLVLETSNGRRWAFAASERQLVRVARHILRELAPGPDDEVLALLSEIRDNQRQAAGSAEQSASA
ncbi:MAG: hypothetical protein OXK79_01390 [Chloroflexota bacterium]|nr:hypothetical protein [Chloroflexota bacterium]